MGGLFDVIIVVDWSAQATPKSGPDSIWSYELDTADGSAVLANHRTRHAARDHLAGRLRHHTGRRALAGFDFPFGYPAGFAVAAGIARPGEQPWQATWRHLAEQVTDDARNRNNRWIVAADLNRRIGHHAFWGVPARRAGRHLASTKRLSLPPPLVELRTAEAQLRQHGLHPFSVWGLLGAGSVGSQALTGIPVLHHLRHAPGLAQRTQVWPFETGLTDEPGSAPSDAIVLAEVWPSGIAFELEPHPQRQHTVKDARQVSALAHHLAARDAAGLLAGDLRPNLAPEVAAAAQAEEGWVLGVPA